MSSVIPRKRSQKILAAGVLVAVAAALITAASLPTNAASEAAKTPLVESPGARHAATLSDAFRQASKNVLPAVVSIQNERPMTGGPTIERRFHGSPDDLFKNSPFEDMFRDRPELKRFFQPQSYETPSYHKPTQAMPFRSSGMGSGVIIDPSGVILTNNHVVAGGGEVTVRLQDGREFEAVEVKTDPKTDIAVVRIEGASDLIAARLGNSETAQIGDWVLALGQPFGLQGTVTAGIVSAKGRGIGITDRENFIQTDAAINPGNSGGPLVNLAGEVVGINTAISSRSGGNDGIGFAVPINLAKWVTDQLLEDGRVHRAFLGVAIQPVTQELAERFNATVGQGVLVSDVRPNSPALAAGIRSGDVIVEFAGKAVDSPRNLQMIVEQSDVGKAHPVIVLRDGKKVELEATLQEQPADAEVAGASGSSPSVPVAGDMGIDVAEMNADVAKRLGMEGHQGVVITLVKSGSPAEAAGLKTGMLIEQVNRQSVTSLDEFRAAVKDQELEDGVMLLVRTPEGSRFVVVRS